jgi:hypothetical protein
MDWESDGGSAAGRDSGVLDDGVGRIVSRVWLKDGCELTHPGFAHWHVACRECLSVLGCTTTIDACGYLLGTHDCPGAPSRPPGIAFDDGTGIFVR